MIFIGFILNECLILSHIKQICFTLKLNKICQVNHKGNWLGILLNDLRFNKATKQVNLSWIDCVSTSNGLQLPSFILFSWRAQSFMVWRFPKHVPKDQQLYPGEITDQMMEEILRDKCKSTYQSDYLGVPQGTYRNKSVTFWSICLPFILFVKGSGHYW